jgi:hypothetical protein
MLRLDGWSEEAREPAGPVLEKYGNPHEISSSVLIWNGVGPWKRLVVYRDVDEHNFPAPHLDSVESFIQHTVPTERVSALAEFDGSVVFNRTRGELSARCHDEEANCLALNLAIDIVEGRKTVDVARQYYGHEFLAYRQGDETPYMNGLRFDPNGLKDPDERTLSDDSLQEAVDLGNQRRSSRSASAP